MTQDISSAGHDAPAEGAADLPPPTGQSPQPAEEAGGDTREQRIRARAYALWEAEGRPAGRETEHWRAAEQDLSSERDAIAETTGYVPQPQEAPTEHLPTIAETEPGPPRKTGR